MCYVFRLIERLEGEEVLIGPCVIEHTYVLRYFQDKDFGYSCEVGLE